MSNVFPASLSSSRGLEAYAKSEQFRAFFRLPKEENLLEVHESFLWVPFSHFNTLGKICLSENYLCFASQDGSHCHIIIPMREVRTASGCMLIDKLWRVDAVLKDPADWWNTAVIVSTVSPQVVNVEKPDPSSRALTVCVRGKRALRFSEVRDYQRLANTIRSRCGISASPQHSASTEVAPRFAFASRTPVSVALDALWPWEMTRVTCQRQGHTGRVPVAHQPFWGQPRGRDTDGGAERQQQGCEHGGSHDCFPPAGCWKPGPQNGKRLKLIVSHQLQVNFELRRYVHVRPLSSCDHWGCLVAAIEVSSVLKGTDRKGLRLNKVLDSSHVNFASVCNFAGINGLWLFLSGYRSGSSSRYCDSKWLNDEWVFLIVVIYLSI